MSHITQRAASARHNLLWGNRLLSWKQPGLPRGMEYAHSQGETSTVSSKLTNLLCMNAEYKSHKQIWQMMKPKVDVRLEAIDPLAQARPPTLAAVPESFEWPLAIMDPATLMHGVRELTSPLSE